MKNGRPYYVERIDPETEEDKRRWNDAEQRKRDRLARKPSYDAYNMKVRISKIISDRPISCNNCGEQKAWHTINITNILSGSTSMVYCQECICSWLSTINLKSKKLNLVWN